MTTSTRVRVRKAKKDQKLEEPLPWTQYQLQSDSDQVLPPRGSKEGEEDQDQSKGDEEEEEDDDDDDDDEEQEHIKERFIGHCRHVQQSQQLCGTLHGKRRIGSHQGKPTRTRKRSYIVSSTTLASKQHAIECVRFKDRMQVGVHQSSSKLRLKNTEGEIEDVHGGRIVRPNGRKDRHSKVCTTKGLRDRRVRLSAHTAIQFYDVQDQLGYDRPSKAIDWLMEKAKKAIDELVEEPNNATTSTTSVQQTEQDPDEQSPNHLQHQLQYNESGTITGSSSGQNIKNLQDFNDNTINSHFFSMAAATPSSSIHFLNHPPALNSRTISRTQDLVLNRHYSSPISVGEPVLISASSALVFDPTRIDLSHLEMPEMGQLQRMIAWNSETGNGGEEFGFNSLPSSPRQLLSQNQLLSQREPLQSSNSSSACAWNKLPISTNGHHQTPVLNPLLASGVEFTSHGFSRFRIPERIQDEDEVQNAVSNKPSSTCSASHF